MTTNMHGLAAVFLAMFLGYYILLFLLPPLVLYGVWSIIASISSLPALSFTHSLGIWSLFIFTCIAVKSFRKEG